MTYDLNAAEIFLEVAAAGSFVQAAKKLRLPTSTVSDRIAALEKSLGVTLLARTTRSMALTDAGNLFLEMSSQALVQLQEAFQQAAGTKAKPSGTLRFSSPLEFAYQEIAEVVRDYRIQFPEVAVEVFYSNELVDFEKDAIDFAIRGGYLKDSNLIARRVGYGEQILLASEAYLRKFPPLKAPKDLLQHTCIAYFNPDAKETVWQLKSTKGQEYKARPKHIICTNSFAAILELVETHQGIAFVPETQLKSSRRKQPMARVLPEWSSGRVPVQIVFPKHRLQSAKVREILPLLVAKLSILLADP
jgi:DNA-binding transcriptional LysR family regulator